ncbi:BatA and WFA domain-containing protein [bacterium]|nr:BatA and WFA domain-containing protein [bacterium]
MNFLTPAAFFLSLLLPVIIAMYLLKLRRQPKQVPSVFLWRQLVRDVEANAPWQKLRRNLLMILQLLFLIALIIALAEPFTFSEGAGGENMILIIDSSASMTATDVQPSRLEAAKAQAQSFVEGAPEATRITLIEAGNRTEILVSASQDRRQVQQALNNIKPGVGDSDMSTALQLTAAITLRQPNTDIFIFSDGRTELPDRLNLNGNLYYYPIGIDGNNQGISNIQLEQNASGDNNTLFVQVTNYGSEEIERRLEIYLDGVLYDAASLELNGYAQSSYIRDSIPLNIQTIETKLAGEDNLSLDNTAWIVPQNLDPVEVLLVTSGNRFLEAAFGLLPNVQVTSLSPMDYQLQEDLPTSELVVFDNFVPVDEQIPQTNLLFIAPPTSTPFFSLVGNIQQPTPRKTDPNDSLLEGIAIDQISILDAAAISQPDWAKVSLSGDIQDETAPLLFYGTTQGQKVAVISFQLQHSDLPLQVAFPLLIANLTNWLAPNRIENTSQIDELATLSFSVPLGTQQVTITGPDGSKLQEIPGENGEILVEDAQPGIYQLNWGDDSQAQTVVNFFSPTESDIKPLGQLSISNAGNSSENLTLNQSKRIFWRPIAIIALILLLFEWFVYHRGTLSKLWVTVSRKEQA